MLWAGNLNIRGTGTSGTSGRTKVYKSIFRNKITRRGNGVSDYSHKVQAFRNQRKVKGLEILETGLLPCTRSTDKCFHHNIIKGKDVIWSVRVTDKETNIDSPLP